MSYDVRDRARFLRSLTIPLEDKEGLNELKQHIQKILLSDDLPTANDTITESKFNIYIYLKKKDNVHLYMYILFAYYYFLNNNYNK